jgi:G3E family GTPase
MSGATSQQEPTPVTVFTGFLGAGKTTIILSLINRLPQDYKVVLLKNEFGNLEGTITERMARSTYKIS